MKKILSIILLVSALFLMSEIASAANTTVRKTTQNVIKYTKEQQTCISNAQKKQQAAIKAAQDIFNTATKNALQTKQAAIKAAQTTKNTKTRMTALRAANDAYNNDSTVKQSKGPYTDALKAANDAYNNDNTVKQAKEPYNVALKAARIDITKECVGTSNATQNKPVSQPTKILPENLNIVSILAVPDINVSYETVLGSVGLPATATVKLSDSTTQNITVIWDNGMPTYDPNIAGTYVFSGNLMPPDDRTNNDDFKATVNVIIAQQQTLAPTTAPAPLPDIETTTSPSDAANGLTNQAASSLLNGFWNFIKQNLR